MSSHKRKRSSSVFSSTSRASSQHALPADTINPLSHSEATIKQLRVAGLTEKDILPARYIANFPHRPITTGSSSLPHVADDDSPAASDDEEDGGSSTDAVGATTDSGGGSKKARSDDDDKARRARAMRDAQDRHLGVLTGVVLRGLEEGDVPRARRAFGLVQRSEVRGKPVDLRRNGLWELGAEVLMREGEEKSRSVVRTVDDVGHDDDDDDDDLVRPDEERRRDNRAAVRRWGSAANMPRLRVYLEGLIRQYPYNRLHPKSTSDLDFYPVLFGCEFYDCWVEHKLSLQRLDQDAETWSDDMPMMHPDDDDDNDEYDDQDEDRLRMTGRERRLRQEKADLALRAMATMRDLATRMDALLENAPYNRSPEMLRLRGMTALYVGDLGTPPAPRTEGEEVEGRRVRGDERARARVFFTKMRENGGRVDPFTEKWLEGAGDDDDGVDEAEEMDSAWGGLPFYSSLPMRGG